MQQMFLQLSGEVSFPKIDILDKRRFLHRTANVGELVRINREGYNNYDVSVLLCPHREAEYAREDHRRASIIITDRKMKDRGSRVAASVCQRDRARNYTNGGRTYNAPGCNRLWVVDEMLRLSPT